MRNSVFADAHLELDGGVLIIGGGINGLAIFRELALQGVDVLLVERDDYMSGASAASSHMIHGGIRYLENGEFRLVRESVHERNRLLRLAPHVVRPLETVIPISSMLAGVLAAPARFLTHRVGRPRARGALLIKLGLTIYDLFSRKGGSVPRHRFRGSRATGRLLPELDRAFRFTAAYFDASVHDPERLGIDLLVDGIDAHPGARAVNYAEAVSSGDDGVRILDRLAGRAVTARASLVINVTGPWVDVTNSQLGEPTRWTGGTKGSHIVLDHSRLAAAVAGRELFFEHADGRIVLIYPLKGRVMVGTTDLPTDMSSTAVCTDDEVDYFLDLIAHVFPDIPVSREQIVHRFSGVRPLPAHGDLKPGFVSRDYRVVRGHLSAGSKLTVVGGKLTTFRALGERVTDEALAILGRDRIRSTVDLAIGGGASYPADPAARAAWITARSDGMPPATAEHLLERYGTRADELLRSYAEFLEDRPVFGLSVGEIVHAVDREQAAHVVDIVLRRTSLGFEGRFDADLARAIAEVMAGPLGWSMDDTEAEIAHALRYFAERHGRDDLLRALSAGKKASRTTASTGSQLTSAHSCCPDSIPLSRGD